MPSLQELEVYRQSRLYRVDISTLTKSFPKEEKFRLSDQLIRASRSIPANIAEGYGRFHYQENIQFLRIARGSLFECKEHLACALDEKFIDKEKFEMLDKKFDQLLKLINGYIYYLKQRKK